MTETAFDLSGPVKLQVVINSNSGYPAGVLSEVLSCITEVVHEIEVFELVQVGKNFPELKLLDVKKAITLAHDIKERHFTVTTARSGSLILTGIVAGVSLWALNITLGETLKEAWLESDLHAKLKEFLKLRLNGKKREIRDELESSLAYLKSLRNYGENPITVTIDENDKNILVKIELDFGVPKSYQSPPSNSPPGNMRDIGHDDISIDDFAEAIIEDKPEFEEFES